jgi:hypothetical protein
MPTRSPFVIEDNLLLTTRKASVEATIRAADDDTPEAAGMVLAMRESIPTGSSFDPAKKKRSRTPYR